MWRAEKKMRMRNERDCDIFEMARGSETGGETETEAKRARERESGRVLLQSDRERKEGKEKGKERKRECRG